MNTTLPGHPRYQPKNLVPYFGYDYNYGFVTEVEIATMRTLAEINIIPLDDIKLLTPDLVQRLMSITTTEVDKVEREITKHDIRAWVRLAQEILPAKLRRWVHIPLTSYDALDTARSLQFVRAHQKVVSPLVKNLISTMADKVKEFSQTMQIGRTHGQHALPITVGFWLATILNRIVENAVHMDQFASGLVGKISGAVGAYNAQVALGMTSKDTDHYESFESRVLKKLGLPAARISTQFLPPEPLVYYLFSVTMMSAALGQLGLDCRNLMRTEIGEIGEPFSAGQVGSSTMAHKRNPITFENAQGMWLKNRNEFGKVMDTLLSEHQRDLVGSCVARDFPVMVVNLVNQLNAILRTDTKGKSFLERISVDVTACGKNFHMQSGVILAEPIYIALQMWGYEGDAHELVNHRAMPLVGHESDSLLGAVRHLGSQYENVAEVLQRIPPDIMALLEKPEHYTGLAVDKALRVSRAAYKYVNSGIPW